MSTTPPQPEPGIYPGVAFDDYRRWDAMHQSTAKAGYLPGRVLSMRRLKAAVDGLLGHKDTTALKDGTDLHAVLLEPERFAAEYQTLPEFKGTGSVKAKAEFLASHPGVVFVKPDKLVMLKAMRASVMTHPVVAMFREAGGCEVSVCGEIMGVRTAARLDKYLPDWFDGPVVLDIKSVRAGWITEDQFGKHAFELGYDIQADWYERTVESVTGTRPMMLFVVCEKEPPYDVVVHQLHPQARKIGANSVNSLLGQYKHCLTTGVWPGYSDQVVETNLPNWFIKQRRHEL